MAEFGYGGRVLAGEDSEEDEEEEELDFQFGSFGGSSSSSAPPASKAETAAVQPKFSIAAPSLAASTGTTGEEEEDEESEQSDTDVVETSTTVEVNVQEADTVDDNKTTQKNDDHSVAEAAGYATRRESGEKGEPSAVEPVWAIDVTVNGSEMMGNAVFRKLQPSLDATIRRIAELTENQQRLLQLLSTQNKSVCSNAKIENIAIVMGKLPQYVKKAQDMKTTMTEISASIERMRKRAENLRVDAQSHAIKKENKRESLTQWNKLYAAKNSGSMSMSSMAMGAPPTSAANAYPMAETGPSSG